MGNVDIYGDVSNIDLGSEIHKLEEQNKQLLEYIRKLESDIEKLCSQLTDMKKVQQNLSKNISELFKTAKVEIERKDRIISELREEIDNLILGKANRIQFKRERNINEISLPAKRFKEELHRIDIKPENKYDEVSEKIISKNRVNRNINRSDESGKDYKQGLQNNPYQQNLRNERENDRFSDRTKRNEQYRSRSIDRSKRSRSTDRSKRSRSNDRSKRSRSNDRFRRSRSRSTGRNRGRSKSNDRCKGIRSNERYNKQNKSNNRNRTRSIEKNNKCPIRIDEKNRSSSRDRNYSRSKSKEGQCENYRRRNLSRNRQKSDINSYKTNDNYSYISEEVTNEDDYDIEKLISHQSGHSLYVITDELEEGEIAPSPVPNKFNNLKIQQNSVSNCSTKDCSVSGPKSETKPITIDQYRNRQKKHVDTVTSTITKDPHTENILDDLQITSGKTMKILDTVTSTITNDSYTENILDDFKISSGDTKIILETATEKELKNKIDTSLEKSRTEYKIENTEMSTKESSITSNVLNETELHHIPSNCQESALNEHSLNSSNLELSSMSNEASNISSANISLNSSGGGGTNVRNRRRRCVVIGIKNKS